MNAQAMPISLTEYSLLFRSVIVTKALEPRPPRRQDCDEIFRPSTGAGCSGTIVPVSEGSKAAAFGPMEAALASPTVVGALAKASATGGAAGRCFPAR